MCMYIYIYMYIFIYIYIKNTYATDDCTMVKSAKAQIAGNPANHLRSGQGYVDKRAMEKATQVLPVSLLSSQPLWPPVPESGKLREAGARLYESLRQCFSLLNTSKRLQQAHLHEHTRTSALARAQVLERGSVSTLARAHLDERACSLHERNCTSRTCSITSAGAQTHASTVR